MDNTTLECPEELHNRLDREKRQWFRQWRSILTKALRDVGGEVVDSGIFQNDLLLTARYNDHEFTLLCKCEWSQMAVRLHVQKQCCGTMYIHGGVPTSVAVEHVLQLVNWHADSRDTEPAVWAERNDFQIPQTTSPVPRAFRTGPAHDDGRGVWSSTIFWPEAV